MTRPLLRVVHDPDQDQIRQAVMAAAPKFLAAYTRACRCCYCNISITNPALVEILAALAGEVTYLRPTRFDNTLADEVIRELRVLQAKRDQHRRCGWPTLARGAWTATAEACQAALQ